ncbi:hypothetical protein A9Q81_11175 [Gammaproteobacteria bacterium 42_54_T18]|nr:hypothetical protein A9Q81_11175 [Gammaproteobacteria bacterium 42_54_T18]
MTPYLKPRASQSGTVIITVLMLIAVATYLAVEMTYRQRIDITRTGTLLALSQSEENVKSAEALAQYVLVEDFLADIKKTPSTDDLEEQWTTPVQTALGQGVIEGEITDLQGRFNINRLLLAGDSVVQFVKLLGNLHIPIDSSSSLTPASIAARVVDWLDENHDLETDGHEDQEYLLLDPAYTAADRILVDLSELMLIAGITREDLERLAPHVALLPPSTKLNVNTATDETLKAYCLDANTIGPIQASGGYDKESDLDDIVDPGKGSLISNCTPVPARDDLSLETDFFLLKAKATIDKRSINMHSVLYRSGSTASNVKVKVILRKHLDPFSGV